MEVESSSIKDWVTYRQRYICEEEKAPCLDLIHINIRSIHKNWDLLELYLEPYKNALDVIILTEVNVDDLNVKLYQINDFEQFAVCRHDRRGGGVIIYVRNNWLGERQSITINEAEVLLLSIESAHASFIICAIYRPPDKNIGTFLGELQHLLTTLEKRDNIILVGDLNIDTYSTTKKYVSDYLTLISSYGLENNITGFTREEFLGNKLTTSCIDHILTRVSSMQPVTSIVKEKVADHYFIALTMFCDDITKLRAETKHKFDIFDNQKMDRLIKEFNWDTLLTLNHLQAYDKLIVTLKSFYDKCRKVITIKKGK